MATQIDGLVVRQACHADLPQIGKIYLTAFPETVEQLHLEHVKLETIEEIMRIPLDAEPNGFFVAEISNRVVGYAICPSRSDQIWRAALWRGHLLRLLWRWLTGRAGIGIRSALQVLADKAHFLRAARKPGTDCPARLLSIAVTPGSHGCGIVRRLLREGLCYLRRVGAPSVRLEVRPGNKVAKHLYESLGFRRESVQTRESDSGQWQITGLKLPRGSQALEHLFITCWGSVRERVTDPAPPP